VGSSLFDIFPNCGSFRGGYLECSTKWNLKIWRQLTMESSARGWQSLLLALAHAHLRASPPPHPHQQTPLFIKSCITKVQILLLSGMDGPFCSHHFNSPSKLFSIMNLDSEVIRPDVKT
jgi:hypothetical protein